MVLLSTYPVDLHPRKETAFTDALFILNRKWNQPNVHQPINEYGYCDTWDISDIKVKL